MRILTSLHAEINTIEINCLLEFVFCSFAVCRKKWSIRFDSFHFFLYDLIFAVLESILIVFKNCLCISLS